MSTSVILSAAKDLAASPGVILSAAKDLARLAKRCFDTLSMTKRCLAAAHWHGERVPLIASTIAACSKHGELATADEIQQAFENEEYKIMRGLEE